VTAKPPAAPAGGVFAVRCPNPKCQKFMLVEEHDRNKVVSCLLCKTPIKVGGVSQSGGRG
jgi:hypothetical protein